VDEDPNAIFDRRIDRLDRALHAAGFEGLAPAVEAASLDELAREVAPYALPHDLRRFWERVDPSSLRVHGHMLPEPRGPYAALETHRQNRDPAFLPFYGPPLLFPFARISADQWSVELMSDWSTGGTVFSHDGESIRVEYPSLSDLLEVYAELLEEGRFVRRKTGYGSLDRDAEQERRQARLTAATLDPHYRDVRMFGLDPAGWPPHWLESAGRAATSGHSGESPPG
jgi:hypothetical protein